MLQFVESSPYGREATIAKLVENFVPIFENISKMDGMGDAHQGNNIMKDEGQMAIVKAVSWIIEIMSCCSSCVIIGQ